MEKRNGVCERRFFILMLACFSQYHDKFMEAEPCVINSLPLIEALVGCVGPVWHSSIGFSLFYHSDVLGVWISLPRLVVNIHPASTHALDVDCPAIHVDFIGVNRGDGHFGGSAIGPPLNNQFFDSLYHLS